MVAERRRRWSRPVALACVLGASGFAADAGYIHAKAGLAQWLLQRAWQQQVEHGRVKRPWPQADLHPVGRLHALRLGVAQTVVAGDSGRSLAFGPGWAQSSAAPGTSGTTVISGHRDTHFAWLRALRNGDVLQLDGSRGSRRYRVAATTVVDAGATRLALDAGSDRLLLVTCWPFDALLAGGAQRYVIDAAACDDCG